MYCSGSHLIITYLVDSDHALEQRSNLTTTDELMYCAIANKASLTIEMIPIRTMRYCKNLYYILSDINKSGETKKYLTTDVSKDPPRNIQSNAHSNIQ